LKQAVWWCCASFTTAVGLLCALASWGWRLPAGFGASTACVVAACGAPFLIGQGIEAVARLTRIALEAGLVLPATVGLIAVVGVSGLVVALVVAATHPDLWRLARSQGLRAEPSVSAVKDVPGSSAPAWWDELPSAQSQPEAPDQLRALADDELCLAWRRSFVRLKAARSTAERLLVVEQRQGYLDELQRRSPDAFASWIVAGARAPGNPLPHLRAHPPRSG
jgi:hypothetical protein